MHDLCLGLVEGKPTGFQPPGKPGLDLLGLRAGHAQDGEVVSVSDQDGAAAIRAPGVTALRVVPDPGGLFHAVQCHVHQAGAAHPALWDSLPGRGEPAVLQHARLEPLADQSPGGEGSQRGEDVLVAEPVEGRLQVGI